MNRTIIARFLGTLLLIAAFIVPAGRPAQAATAYDIIIYGGGFSGVAAALHAQDTYRYLKGGLSANILLINGFSGLGGLGTVNGQNFYDIKAWPSPSIQPQGGNHQKFYNQFGQFYSTSEMAAWMSSQISAKGGITVLQPYDLRAVSRDTTTGKITGVTVQRLVRGSTGVYLFDSSAALEDYTAPVVIDAGENSRLARLAGLTTSLGREDNNADKRQQVMTLMFKVKNISVPSGTGWSVVPTEADGSRAFLGGTSELSTGNLLAFNTSTTHARFRIKAMNAAEDRTKNISPATGIGEYWLNTLLIYNVDSTCERKDGCPDIGTNGAWSIDYAYEQAYNKLNDPAFINAMKQFTGFSGLQYVYGTNGRIVTGETLYIREASHLPVNPAAAKTDTNFALAANELWGAGAAFNSVGATDLGNFERRIGLSFYAMDSNGYTKTCTTSCPANGDPNPNPYGSNPSNPVYIPIDTILTSQAPNLLVAGYSASTSSWGWTQLRVLPNLTVLGDAAGISAAYALHSVTDPYNFPCVTITNIQNRIVALTGKITKTTSDNGRCGGGGRGRLSWPTVQIGAINENARTIQHMLRVQGYTSIVADGNFGPATETAVKNLQTARGLPSTGIVNGPTWEVLLAPAKQGDSGDRVIALQRQLNLRGAGLVADGAFGPGTNTAVVNFQNSNSLNNNGIAHMSTWCRLVGGTIS